MKSDPIIEKLNRQQIPSRKGPAWAKNLMMIVLLIIASIMLFNAFKPEKPNQSQLTHDKFSEFCMNHMMRFDDAKMRTVSYAICMSESYREFAEQAHTQYFGKKPTPKPEHKEGWQYREVPTSHMEVLLNRYSKSY